MTHKTPIATPLWLCDENGNPLDEGQKKLAVSVGQNLLIVAGPGSGKTRVLVSHYLHLLMERRDWDVHNIAAITFTEKAAAEMKTRVQKILLNVVQKSHDQQDRERARYLLDSLGHAQVQTIHSFCADLLRQHALQLGLDPSFTGLDETAANLLKSEVTDSFLIKVLDDSFDPLHDAVRFIVENWSYEKTSRILQHLLKIRAYLHSVGSDGDLRIIVDELDRPGVRDYWKQCYTAVERHYDQEKWRRNCLDFDDLLIKTWNLLQDDGVRDRIRSQYRYILVDELQDVDALQMEIIKSLCGWDEGRVSFFGVGDPMQSIYRFRGAMVEKLRSLEEEFRQRRWACQMKRNYRSSDKIVRFLNYLFSRLFQERAEVVGQTAVRSDRLSPPVTITVYRGTKSRTEVLRREAWAIAQTIRKIVSGNSSEDRRTHFRDIAVLLRDTRHINVLTDVFREAAIPYHVLSGYGFFETQEIKDLITFLEAISEPDNDLAAAAFLRSPFVGISDPTLLLLRQKGLLNWQAVVGTEEWKSEQLSEISSAEAKRLNWGKYLLREGAKRLDQGAVRVLEWLLEETEYEAILTALPHGKQALANVRKFIRLTDQASRNLNLTIHRLVRHLREIASPEIRIAEEPPQSATADAVQIVTIHSSKGLEFPVVFVPMLGEIGHPRASPQDVVWDPSAGAAIRYRSPLNPQIKRERLREFDSVDKKRIEEESQECYRILFVACSRAQDQLYLIGSERTDGKRDETILSEVLTALGVELGSDDWVLPEGVREFVTLKVCEAPSAPKEAERKKSLGEQWLENPEVVPEMPDATMPDETVRLPIGSAPIVVPVSLLSNAEEWRWDGVTLSRKGVGSVVHELAKLDLLDPDQATILSLARKLRVPLSQEDVEAVLKIVRRLSADEEWSRAISSSERYKELEFQVAVSSDPPFFIRGRWDMVYKDGFSWVVVDLKTEEVEGEGDAQERCRDDGIYGFTIQAYAYAAHKIFGAEKVSVRYLFLAPEKPILVERCFNTDQWIQTAERLKERIEQVATSQRNSL